MVIGRSLQERSFLQAATLEKPASARHDGGLFVFWSGFEDFPYVQLTSGT
jgi:hypothetical protein